MKNPMRPSSCGCRRPPPPRPAWPEEPCRGAPDHPPFSACGGFLMQRVFAAGVLRRRVCHCLCLDGLPQQAREPFAVTGVSVSGSPQWEEAPCRSGRGMLLRVSVPIQFQVRDGCGGDYCLMDSLEESLSLRAECPPASCWQGQPFVQAAVRLGGRARCSTGCCEVPLEIRIEGYMLAPCVMGRPDMPPCPPSRPWYPRPMFDPYNE